jgi:ribosomal protein L7/L12
MRLTFRCYVALVALGLSISALRADAPAPSGVTLRTALREAINHGVDLYNSGDHAGCYHVFEGALLTVRPLLTDHPELQKSIADSLSGAEREPLVWRRAFALRATLDRVRADLNPKKELEPKKEPIPEPKKEPIPEPKKEPVPEKKDEPKKEPVPEKKDEPKKEPEKKDLEKKDPEPKKEPAPEKKDEPKKEPEKKEPEKKEPSLEPKKEPLPEKKDEPKKEPEKKDLEKKDTEPKKEPEKKDAEKPAEFKVVIDGVTDPAKKLGVIKVIREQTGLGLAEAKDLVEGPPMTVKAGLSKADAEALKAKLEEAGAKVSIK